MDKVGSILDFFLSTVEFCDEGMLSCLAVVDVVVLMDGGDSIIYRCWS